MLENKNPRSDNNIKEDELIFNHYSTGTKLWLKMNLFFKQNSNILSIYKTKCFLLCEITPSPKANIPIYSDSDALPWIYGTLYSRKQQRHFIKEHRCKSVSVLCVFKCLSTSCPDFRLSFTRCLVIFSQVICLSLHSENTTANTSPSYLYTIWHTKLTSKDWAQTPVVWQPTTTEKSFIPSQTSSLCLVFWSVRHSEVY